MPQPSMFDSDADARAKETGRLLAQYLKRANTAQKELAAYLGVADTYVSRMVRGHLDWANSKYFGRIAGFLKLKEDEIRRLQPAAVVDYTAEMTGLGDVGVIPQEMQPVQIPPNLTTALDLLSREDKAYANPLLAEKLALADPEDGNVDPPVSDWMELAKVVMRMRRKR